MYYYFFFFLIVQVMVEIFLSMLIKFIDNMMILFFVEMELLKQFYVLNNYDESSLLFH
jgi:hypothetical protein